MKALTDGLGLGRVSVRGEPQQELLRVANPTHVVRVNNGAFVLENCYGLTDADFEHEEQTGDATARALAEAATNAPSSTGTDVVEEEKELVVV